MNRLLPLAAFAVVNGVALAASAATFVTPTFFGLPGTTTQTWQGFTSPPGPNPATTATNPAGTPNWFDRTAATDGAFNIGVAPAARIYSPAGVVNPQVDVPTPTLAAVGARTQIVLQAAVRGNPLDVTQFFAKSSAGVSYAPASVTSSADVNGLDTDYLVTFVDLPATSSSYALTYTPNATSSSQSAARVDTLTSVVPEPASLATFAIVGGAIGAFRRRSTEA